MKKLSKVLLLLIYISIFDVSLIFAQDEITDLKVGEIIPNFKYYALDGKEYDSKEIFGKKILINFSATWCPYCIEEKSKFEKEYKNLKEKNENLEIVILFGGYGKKIERRDTIDKVDKYMKENQYTFQVYFDKDREVIEKFKVHSIPTSILVDEKGQIIEINEEYYKLDKLKK